MSTEINQERASRTATGTRADRPPVGAVARLPVLGAPVGAPACLHARQGSHRPTELQRNTQTVACAGTEIGNSIISLLFLPLAE